MNTIIRNLAIFVVVTLASGWLGLWLDRVTGAASPQAGLGMLLWLIAPVGAGLVLRLLGGDDGHGFGFRPRLRASWRWYLAGVLVFPLVALLVLGLGALLGQLTLSVSEGPGLRALLMIAAGGFAASLVKNLFEEFAWRGYLTPRVAALRLHPLLGHVLTGLVWGGWHLPYWFGFLSDEQLAGFTPLSRPAFASLGILILAITAVTYGELRLLSGSTWPAVLLHTITNALTLGFVTHGYGAAPGAASVLLSPGNDGLLNALVFGLIGLGLYRHRLRHKRQPDPARGAPRPWPISPEEARQPELPR